MELVHVMFPNTLASEAEYVLTQGQKSSTAIRNRVLCGGWPGNEIRYRLLESHPGGYLIQSAAHR